METYFYLMEQYGLDAGLALQCRLGVGSIFFRLGRQYLQLGYAQRAANLFQLAMSMFWDAHRDENGIQCLQYEMWGVRWFDQFMELYLGHAAALRRNDAAMLPHPATRRVPLDFRDPSLRIAVFSLCDYAPESPMRWLLARSRENRNAYCGRHGYTVEWTDRLPARAKSRHPVWGQLAGPLELMEAPGSQLDWVMSMDCDSLFVNMDVTLDHVLYRFAGRDTPWGTVELDPGVHFLISEDGRGLAGGNWIVRNSATGRAFLRDVYGSDDEAENAYMRHDLRDQFSLLWHLVRPGVSTPTPGEQAVSGVPAAPHSWADVGYAHGVRLVPQEFLLGSYPFVSCSQPGDRAHRCFQGSRETAASGVPPDFIVSVPLLSSLPQQMAQAVLDRFLLESLGRLGDQAYEAQLRGLCPQPDVSRCLVGQQ